MTSMNAIAISADRGGGPPGAQPPDRLLANPGPRLEDPLGDRAAARRRRSPGECRSRVMWRRIDSSSCSERATSASPKRSKAALLARRWPAEKP